MKKNKLHNLLFCAASALLLCFVCQGNAAAQSGQQPETKGFTQRTTLDIYQLFSSYLNYTGEYYFTPRASLGASARLGSSWIFQLKGASNYTAEVSLFGRYYFAPFHTEGVKDSNGFFGEAKFNTGYDWESHHNSPIKGMAGAPQSKESNGKGSALLTSALSVGYQFISRHHLYAAAKVGCGCFVRLAKNTKTDATVVPIVEFEIGYRF